MKELKIGNIKLKNSLFLAPMVDVTDLPYRLLCRKAGAGMAYTEMIYINAILHENKRTKKLMKTCNEDKPIGLQITGNSEKEFEELVKEKLSELKKFDLIDLNCGCPSMKIAGNKAGSFLLNNPEKIGRIIKILKDAGLTVTAKIRLGFRKNNVLEVARIVEDAGANAIAVHARLAVDGNDVKADWKWIAKVKEKVKIPVIGNGDVFSGEDAKKMLKICDGVMIGRAAIGEPLVFERILNYLETGKEDEFDLKKNLELFKEYIKLENKYYGEEIDMGHVKYVGSKFLRGFRGAAKMREKFMKLKSFEEIEEFVNSLCL